MEEPVESFVNLEEYALPSAPLSPLREESPVADLPDATQMDEDMGVPDLGATDSATTAPMRRKLPKLDASRLVDASKGYPVLLEKLRRIKYRGRGDERRYLEKYMMTYQLWANRLWPKAKVADFMQIARTASRDPQIRWYCRDLIELEKEGPRRTDRDTESTEPQATEPQAMEPNNSIETAKLSEKIPVATRIDTSIRLDEIPDDIPDLDQLGSLNGEGPDEDELAAAAELYGDMNF